MKEKSPGQDGPLAPAPTLPHRQTSRTLRHPRHQPTTEADEDLLSVLADIVWSLVEIAWLLLRRVLLLGICAFCLILLSDAFWK
jgi:hypothetical protein